MFKISYLTKKHPGLATLAFILVLSGIACAKVDQNNTAQVAQKNVTPYTAESIIEIARKFSPDCQVKKAPTDNSSGWCNDSSQYEKAEPVFIAQSIGNGVWSVTKTCPVNPVYSRLWYFYEDTRELVIQPAKNNNG